MTRLGYQWKRDQSDHSLKWDHLNHWELWSSADYNTLAALVLRLVVICGGDPITTDVACAVSHGPDQTLGRWELNESWVGNGKEIDPTRYKLEELAALLAAWANSLGMEGGR